VHPLAVDLRADPAGVLKEAIASGTATRPISSVAPTIESFKADIERFIGSLGSERS
jgi:hypothetical protein